jgi:hypothetical protein
MDAVRNGISFLDFIYGREKWVKKIDLDILDLNNARSCIIGQLEGNFWNAEDDFPLDREDSVAFGFLSRELSMLRHELLTNRWRKAITKLRNELLV